jgi:transposase InsO family protein
MKVLPYGVEFATDKVQETLTKEFFDFLDIWMLIYVDNMLIHTSTKREHLQALKLVFQRCSVVNLHVRKEKCSFMKTSIKTMGFVVEHNVIRPDPSKIDMLQKAQPPTNVEQLQSFLGLTQFYRNMLPHLAHVAYPLYAATSENYDFQWTTKLHQAFLQIKAMISDSILQTNLEGEQDVVMYVDASKHAVCAVLVQRNRIVYCASKVLNMAQRNWSTIERELFAVSWGCKKMRCFVYGIKFVIFTDHKPLVGLLKKKTEVPNTRMQQMMLSASEYDFDLQYLPGTRNVIADYGTRQIKLDEWDKPKEDDPEGLHELMVLDQSDSVNLVYFHKENMSAYDLELIDKSRLQLVELDTDWAVVETGSDRKIWLPHDSKRAFFWQIHSELHIGLTKLLQYLRRHKIYWHNAPNELQQMLSQCVCSNKKDSKPKPYSEKKNIVAKHVLHILAVDLYKYAERLYFTAVCIFSRNAWVKQIRNAEASTVLSAYTEYCNLFQEPLLISSDNGGEFSLIETAKIHNPSYHPQANGVVERFHLELGKQSRIHGIFPDEAYKIINTEQSSLMMEEHLEAAQDDEQQILAAFQYATRQFSYNDLVWKHVVRRARAKHEDTYTGPHRILSSAGKFSFNITSHLQNERKLQVNINDLKLFQIPDTRGWTLKDDYFEEAVHDLNTKVRNPCVLINFAAINDFVQDVLDGKMGDQQFFVVPEWPCAPWYKRLHLDVQAEAVRLPKKVDLFLDKKGRSLGMFSWENWLFALDEIPVQKT